MKRGVSYIENNQRNQTINDLAMDIFIVIDLKIIIIIMIECVCAEEDREVVL